MKRCNLIKRFFIGLLLIVVASISANAQEGLYAKSILYLELQPLATATAMRDPSWAE